MKNILSISFCLLLVVHTIARAEDLSDKEVLKTLTVENARDKAIKKALSFLESAKNSDGSSGTHNKPALTGLSIMAFLSAGHTFEDPVYGDSLARSLRTVLGNQDASGYYGGGDNGRMYGHGIITLMLAESLGMTKNPELEERIHKSLEKAVGVTIQAALVPKQLPHAGGWHYQPDSHESDLSLSGWQLMSLHAAEQVGIPVPANVISNAVAYAKRLTSRDGKVGYRNREEDHPALRGLGLLSLAIGNQLDAPEVGAIGEKIQSDPFEWEGRWVFYRAYYDAVGLNRALPKVWEKYGPRMEKIFIDHQNPDGSWEGPPQNNEYTEGGAVYVTSMAVLALTVNRHVLPAYQR